MKHPDRSIERIAYRTHITLLHLSGNADGEAASPETLRDLVLMLPDENYRTLKVRTPHSLTHSLSLSLSLSHTHKRITPNSLPGVQFLIRFLFEVCQQSEVNKMTPSNMSIVFGPTLLAPAVFSLESSLNSTFVSQTVESMIEVRCMSVWLPVLLLMDEHTQHSTTMSCSVVPSS